MDKTAIVVWIVKSLLGSHNGIVNRCAGTLARAALIGVGVHTATIGDNETNLLAGEVMAGVGVLLGLAHKVWDKYGAAIEARIATWINRPLPPAALAGLLLALAVSSARAETNSAPRFYMVAASALEAHHDANARSSDYGYVMHAGVDYGAFAIEGVMEGPLVKEQNHVRRSLGVDVLFLPISFKYVKPFVCAGGGYYFPAGGPDVYATWAADVGAGVRLPVSEYVFLQIGARTMIPFDVNGNVFRPRDHFEIVEIGIGARY